MVILLASELRAHNLLKEGSCLSQLDVTVSVEGKDSSSDSRPAMVSVQTQINKI